MILECPPQPRTVLVYWTGLAAVLTGLAILLAASAPAFGYLTDMRDLPALETAAGLVVAGLVALLVLPLIRQSVRAGMANDRKLLMLILAMGLLFRLILLLSAPAFEDDYYRYLWDGAVTANGYNPYAVSPDEAQGDAYATSLQPLAHASGIVIERINHSDLKTIYPPVAEAAFALAHMLEPWSLTAWRLVCLAADFATALLILALLRDLNRPLICLALYWWNPVAIKELVNSAHMEAVLMPFVVGAVLLAVRRRWTLSSIVLGLAAGIKIWPLMLVPLLFRPLMSQPAKLAPVFCIVAGLTALFAVPVLLGGLDQSSGFVAYAQYWRTNSAHFGVVQWIASTLATPFALPAENTAVIAKGLLAAALAGFVLWLARPQMLSNDDLITRVTIAVSALVLLSPVQFPWYLVWVLPFAAIIPVRWVLAATVMLPLYYVSFYFLARETYDVFRDQFVWLIWLPIWVALAIDIRRGPLNA